MSVVMFMELPGVTTQQYDRLNQEMGIVRPEEEPDGLLFHGCGKTDEGLVIFDIWRSRDDIDDFLNNKLGPAAARLGLPQVMPRFGDLYYQFGRREIASTA
jgi:hypothetical protein